MPSKKIGIYRTFSSQETKKVGYDVARALVEASRGAAAKKYASVFSLQGDLGAGKTTFAQGFLRGLGSKKRVTSPTFILMRRYKLAGKKFTDVFHIDAYRLKKPEHMAALALDGILSGPRNVVLIEWPEKAKRFLPKNVTWIKFGYGKKENERIISIACPALSPRGK